MCRSGFERPEIQHPAHGIAAALERAARPIVVCACDTPFVPPSLISLLANRSEPVVVLESDRGLEPLPGRYSPAARDDLEAAAGRRDVLQVAVEALDPTRILQADLRDHGDPTRILLNVNTKEDLSQAEELVNRDHSIDRVRPSTPSVDS